MNKILTTILMAATIGTVIPAMADGETSSDVLVWFIDTADAVDGKDSTFDEIKFWAVDPANNNEKVYGLGGLTYWDQEAAQNHDSSGLAGSNGASTAPSGGASIDGFGDTVAGAYYTDISGLNTGYSFLMELYNGGERVNWMLQPVSRSDLEQVIVSISDLNLEQVPTGYNFASTMVPEPSSGLLLLIGGSLLALRRRRRG